MIVATTPDSGISGQVHGIAGWRRLVVWPLALLVRLWGRSLRFEIAPEDLRNLTKRDEPVALILWHNRLFLVAEIVRRFRQGRPAYSLVSASKDGAWLDAFFSQVGMHTVRGSSHVFGREAVLELIAKLRAGHDIGITPDGPRGPRYAFKAGALVVTTAGGRAGAAVGRAVLLCAPAQELGRFLPAATLLPGAHLLHRRACSRTLRDPSMTAEELQRRSAGAEPGMTG